jgi:hypothetical protein
VSDGDRMGSSTQVPDARCAWVPAVMSYHAKHSMMLSPEDLALVALPIFESLGVASGDTGYKVGLRWMGKW